MKKTTSFSWTLAIFAAVLLFAGHSGYRTASAAITGKISGIVKSEVSQIPLANVEITVVGTSDTATTNQGGYYVIANIAPGTYDLKVERAGYTSQTVMDAKVFAGLTTTLDLALGAAEVVTLEEITVTATKPLIKRDVTQSMRIIEAEEIAAMPRDTVNGILQLQAGVSQLNSTGTLHVRGGRSTEVKYLIDGIPVNDPIGRSLGVNISTNSLEQIEIITGGFNAEHGDAQSGVINLITKAGARNFTGRIRYRVGQWGTHHGDPVYGAWLDPDNGFRPVALEPFRGIFLGNPYDYQTPYRGQSVTVEELAAREGDAQVVFTEIVPGVFADRTENPPLPIIDPGTGEPTVNPDTGEVITAPQPYRDTDGTLIDYEKKQVTLLDGYIVDLNQYSGLFNDTKNYDLRPSHTGEFALSGPLWGNRLTFSTASQLRRDESYLPNANGSGYTFQGKLKFEVTPDIRLTASGLFDQREADSYGGSLRFLPSAIPVANRDARSMSLQFSHNLNSGTFYTLTLGQFHRTYESHQPDKLWDPLNRTFEENAWDPEKSFEQNQEEGRIRNPTQQAYNDTNYFIAGDDNAWTTRETTANILKADFSSQVTENHQIRTGIELSTHEIYNLGATNYGSSNLYMEFYDVTPSSLSLYAQDKMEYEGMIVNAGLRYELYSPDGVSPADQLDPLELNDDGTIKLDKSVYKVGLPIIKNPVEASVKQMLAPRLGISFPITDRAKLHFTYGHYYQIPPGDDLYENLSFDMRGAIRRRGNPNLEPERTVAYEVGIAQQLTRDLTVNVTGFTKDIDNLVSSVHVDITNDYSYFINDIYGRVQGFELTARKWRIGHSPISGMINYTYSVAKGKGSSRSLGYLTYYRQQPEVTESHPLAWDQRHVVSGTLDVQLPLDASIHLIGRYGSGLPYTPNPRSPVKPDINSKRYPPTHNVDMLLSKRIRIGELTYTIFADVRNVFNTRNLDDIIDAVTYDRYGIPLNSRKHSSPLAWNSPRLMMMGVSLDF